MIYTEYWNLAFPPFANDLRPENFVPTRSSILAAARLRYALGMNLGAAGVYGPAGVGKTRIARSLLDEFAAAKWLTCYLPNPCVAARELLTALSPAAAPERGDAPACLAALQRFLGERMAAGQPVLLAVDDVQATRDTGFLELLRTLLNISDGRRRALSLLLVGQPEMERRLRAASGLESHLAAKAVVEPMADDETKLYILARLKAAGSRQGIFTRRAADRVTRLSRGVPRQVNRLCELSLLIGFGLETKKVDPGIVEMAAADLDILPGDEAAFFPWPHSEGAGAEEEDGDGGEDVLASLAGENGGGARK